MAIEKRVSVGTGALGAIKEERSLRNRCHLYALRPALDRSAGAETELSLAMSRFFRKKSPVVLVITNIHAGSPW